MSDGALDRRVLAERVGQLYAKGRLAIPTGVGVGAFLVLALWTRIDHKLLFGWLIALMFTAVVRTVLLVAFAKVGKESKDIGRWGTLFAVGSALHGIVWGAAGLLLYTPGFTDYQVLVVFAIGGLAAGTTASTSTYPSAFAAFVVPSLVPAFFRLAYEGDDVHYAMAAMLGLFGVAMAMLARTGGRAFWRRCSFGSRTRSSSSTSKKREERLRRPMKIWRRASSSARRISRSRSKRPRSIRCAPWFRSAWLPWGRSPQA